MLNLSQRLLMIVLAALAVDAVILAPIEEALLRAAVEQIADPFKETLVARLGLKSLAQRHVDWRGIYLYRIVGGRVDKSGLPR